MKEHLGGYFEESDEATYFPQLWRWLAHDPAGPNVRSVLDIGCGKGYSVDYFRDVLGCKVVGLEGVPQNNPSIILHDFALGPYYPTRQFDMVWCCEFLEHIDERFLPNVLPAFQSAKLIFITHAFPGQGGTHHVNCRWPDYWIGFFASAGFRLNHGNTAIARELSRANTSPWNHFSRSGLVFER